MAKFVLTSEYVALNGSDLSAFCNKAELQLESEAKEVTTFGSAGWKEFIAGLKSGTLALEFKQDFAASQLDALLWPMFGTVVSFEVRPTSAVVGAGNPKFTGNVLVAAYNPITGGVGDEATVSISLPTSGQVTRATS